jgi:hypothetical protein
MSSRPGPSRVGFASRQSKPSTLKRNTNAKPKPAIVVDSNSEPEVIVIDEDSDSDIEFMGFNDKISKMVSVRVTFFWCM